VNGDDVDCGAAERFVKDVVFVACAKAFKEGREKLSFKHAATMRLKSRQVVGSVETNFRLNGGG